MAAAVGRGRRAWFPRIRLDTATDRRHLGSRAWALAVGSPFVSEPTEIAYYVCYGPARCRLVDLAWVAGSRWHVEESFQQAKGEAGLDHYQVRTWRAWYAHIILSMLALAWLAASKKLAEKGEPTPAVRA